MPRSNKPLPTKKPQFAYLSLAIISFLVLFSSYAFNIFGLWNYFYDFQKDSESLLINQIECRHIHGQDLFGGMLVAIDKTAKPKDISKSYQDCDPKLFQAYFPQFNIEGHLIAPLAPGEPTHLKYYLQFIKIITVSLLAAAMTYLVITVAREFSMVTALALLVGLALSDWMVFMARNLYWVPVLIFLPFVLSFVFYPKFKDFGKLNKFYLILGASFFAKSLAGYEFLPCVILSSFAPVLYYEIKQRGQLNWRELLNPFIKILGTGIAGFTLAIALNLAQASFYFHSIPTAWAAIQNRALERTLGAPGNTVVGVLITQSRSIEPDFYGLVNNIYYLSNLNPDSKFFPIEGALFKIAAYIFLGLFTIPIVIRQPLAMILQSVAFSVFLSGIIIWIWRKIGLLKNSPQHLALAVTVIYSFISSASWFILAQPHIIFHLHLDGIIYYIPYALVFYIMIGMVIDSLLNKLRSQFTR
jgi:hypothetical protein